MHIIINCELMYYKRLHQLQNSYPCHSLHTLLALIVDGAWRVCSAGYLRSTCTFHNEVTNRRKLKLGIGEGRPCVSLSPRWCCDRHSCTLNQDCQVQSTFHVDIILSTTGISTVVSKQHLCISTDVGPHLAAHSPISFVTTHTHAIGVYWYCTLCYL